MNKLFTVGNHIRRIGVLVFFLGVILMNPTTGLASNVSVKIRAGERNRYEKAIQGLQSEVLSRYSIRVLYSQKDLRRIYLPQTSFQAVTEGYYRQLLDFFIVLIQEVEKYSEKFWIDRGVVNVALVEKLFYQSMPVEGLFNEGFGLLAFDYVRSADKLDNIRHGIHHEIFHLIEMGGDNSEGQSKDVFFIKEMVDNWEQLNSEKFRYISSGIFYGQHDSNENLNKFAPSKKGFVTNYAMKSAQEDRAEVFACLMVESQRKIIERWVKRDEVLNNKVYLMKQYIDRIKRSNN